MENYKRLLSRLVTNRPISQVVIQRAKSVNMEENAFCAELQGASIVEVHRRAKYLIFRLNTGRALLLHLMLGGWMHFGSAADKPQRTVQVELSFGSQSLYFIGLRLGFLHLVTADELRDRLKDLGLDPFDPALDLPCFAKLLQMKRASLKSFFVNQHILSGIGNCYSDEICFAAGLLPARHSDKLETQEGQRLYEAVRSVLEEAVRHGGYMENPLYLGDALTGGFDSLCRVYDRGGEPCVRCGSPIVQDEISSKKTFYCHVCQH